MSRKRKADSGLAPNQPKRTGSDLKSVPQVSSQSAFAAARSDQIPAAAVSQDGSEEMSSSKLSRGRKEITPKTSTSTKRETTNISRQFGTGISISDVLKHIEITRPSTEALESEREEYLAYESMSDSGSSTQSEFLDEQNGIRPSVSWLSFDQYPRTWRQARESLVEKILTAAVAGQSSAKKNTPQVVIQIIGSANAGTTTFVRFLLESILAPLEGLGYRPGEAVAVLDLDTTKAEFSLPGHIGLSIIKEPASSADSPQKSSIPPQSREAIQSHAVGLYAHQDTPELFLAATEQLLQAYRSCSWNGPHPLPLIICSPSFERESEAGMDDRTTSQLTSLIKASHVCCLAYKTSQPSPGITRVRSVVQNGAQLWEMETQNQTRIQPKYIPEELRSISIQSYFHVHSKSLPLSHRKPFKISYDSEESDIAGVFVFGDIPPMYPSMMSKILNGSIVAIVVLQSDYSRDRVDVKRGEGDDIPYFNPGGGGAPKSLDPSQSESIGLGLIRSIDIGKKELYIITPDHVASQLTAIDAERVVLVHGVTDSPGWAFRDGTSAAMRNQESGIETYEFEGDFRNMKPLYLGGAKKGMQVVKTRRFKKKT